MTGRVNHKRTPDIVGDPLLGCWDCALHHNTRTEPPVMSDQQGDASGQRLIRNPLLGTYVVQTPGRMTRREGTTDCPFCAAIARGEWPDGAATWARPNDFPPLRPPLGECYVLLYAREHNLSFVDLTSDRVA